MPLRYVILWHDGIRQPHFDLMFETLLSSALATWRCERWPIESPAAATRLTDHRQAYLEYEGELSERRGHVTRIAAGTCEVDVGEDSVWRITLLTGSPPQVLEIRPVQGDRWKIARESAPHPEPAHKKGGVDLSEFHATQGRRIVDIRDTTPGGAGSTCAQNPRDFSEN